MQHAFQRVDDVAARLSAVPAAGNKILSSSAPVSSTSNGLSVGVDASTYEKSQHARYPSPKEHVHGVAVERKYDEVEVHPGGIGLLPEEVYDKQLHPWAAAFRRRIWKNLAWESEVLAAMQVRACSIY